MKTIRTLKIGNFKSIDSLDIQGLAPFTVFAGANWSGKSNFFDALDFVSLFIRNGIETTLRAHGGFGNIHSEKRGEKNAGIFDFEIECDFPKKIEDQGKDVVLTEHYSLGIHNPDGAPEIEESVSMGGIPLFRRRKGEEPRLIVGRK
uniref:AAA ATPase domain-containing protein n=1 Tax=Candidatus Kentrum sp. TC TaxID=2126339 RepID=A0A450Z494_9GAMM|nr:MAG: AAA ATPase domain-containing protein [Candidatus Kentron sp. TC]